MVETGFPETVVRQLFKREYFLLPLVQIICCKVNEIIKFAFMGMMKIILEISLMTSGIKLLRKIKADRSTASAQLLDTQTNTLD